MLENKELIKPSLMVSELIEIKKELMNI